MMKVATSCPANFCSLRRRHWHDSEGETQYLRSPCSWRRLRPWWVSSSVWRHLDVPLDAAEVHLVRCDLKPPHFAVQMTFDLILTVTPPPPLTLTTSRDPRGHGHLITHTIRVHIHRSKYSLRLLSVLQSMMFLPRTADLSVH